MVSDRLDRASSQAGSARSKLTTSQRLQEMSTRASGHLQPKADMEDEQAAMATIASPKKSLREVIDQNRMYGDVVEQINKKLALRDAIDRANNAIASGKASRTSEVGDGDL